MTLDINTNFSKLFTKRILSDKTLSIIKPNSENICKINNVGSFNHNVKFYSVTINHNLNYIFEMRNINSEGKIVCYIQM